MLAPQNTLFIDGTEGRLHTLYFPAEGRVRGIAVANHPHPLHGGTFTNKVIQTAAKAYAKLGYHCYLPNMRGVGESESSHDGGAGETADCIVVAEYARSRHRETDTLLLSGFSFGGYVAARAAVELQPDALVLLAPAMGMYEIDAPAVPHPERTLVIHGEADEVVALDKVLRWCAPQEIPVMVMPEASHFFHRRLIPLRDLLLRFVPALTERT